MKNKTLKGTSVLALTVAATATSSTIKADEVVQPSNQPTTAETAVATSTTNVTDQQLAEAKQNVTTSETDVKQAEEAYEQATADQNSQQKTVDQSSAELANAEQSTAMTPAEVTQIEDNIATAEASLPAAESAVTEAQTNVDKAQALADQPVTQVVDQAAVDAAQAEVDEKTAEVATSQSNLDEANTNLAAAKSEVADAETLLSRIGSDELATLHTDFDFEAEFGVTAMEYWNSVGGDTNVNSFDGKHTNLSEDSRLLDSTFDLADDVFIDNPNSADSDWELNINDLSDFELRTLSNYAANTINDLRESMQKQLTAAGSNLILPKVQVTEESIATARKYFDWLRANHPGGYEGHVIDHALTSEGLRNSTLTWEEALGNSVSRSASKNMIAAKSAIFNQLSKMLFQDAFAKHGHTSIIFGMAYANMGVTGTQTLTFTPAHFEDGTTKFSFVFTRPDENVVIPNTLPAISDEELSAAKSAAASVTNAEKAVQDATTKLANAKSALTAAEQKLAAVKKGDVAGAHSEVISRLDALEEAKNKLVAAQNKVAELKVIISEGQAKLDAYNKGAQSVADAKAKLAEAEKVLAESKVKTQDALKVYEAAQAKYKAAKAEYDRLLAIRAIEDATKPVEDATETVENTTKPVNNTTKPAEGSTKPGDNTAKPGDNTTKPVDNTTKPAGNTAKPVDNTTNPVDNTTKPVDNGQKSTKPNETGKLALNATKKENYNQVKTLGAGITKKADGTVSYSRIAANNTLPKTGEENNTSSILAGLALFLSGSVFLGKRKED